MSVVSDIVLWCEPADVVTVKKHLKIAGEPIDRFRVGAGGDKRFCSGLFVWAKNYLRLDEFLTELEAIPWRYPTGVVLLVRGEEEECPAVWRLGVTEAYSHDDSVETTLYGATGPHKLVKVVKARAG